MFVKDSNFEGSIQFIFTGNLMRGISFDRADSDQKIERYGTIIHNIIDTCTHTILFSNAPV